MATLVAPIFGRNLFGDLSIGSNTTDAPVDAAFTGSAGATTGSGTNASFSSYLGYPVVIVQYQGTGVGTNERNVITGYSSGTITFGAPLENSYTTGAQILILRDHGKIDIGGGFTWSAKAWDGTTGGILAFTCGLLTGAGGISAIGCGYRGGTGGVNTTSGNQGEGETGTGGGSTAANGMGGGGGNNLGGSGSGGGTNGIAALTSLFPGGGGGGSNVPTGQSAVNGGNGGGIILAYIGNYQLTGTMKADGQSGVGGYRASGAGAGGSILIYMQRGAIGSNLITALGGANAGSSNGGGTGGGGGYAGTGGAGGTTAGGTGGDGRIAIAKGIITDSGTTTPTYTDKGYQTYNGTVGRG